MNWTDHFIEQALANVPEGRYRRRAEKELRDHMETEHRALVESGAAEDEAQAEALRVMGEPEALREEYRAAWKRTLEGRLAGPLKRLDAIAGGCVVMAGTHFLLYYVMGIAWNMALFLPGDSREPWIRLIRGTIGDWNNSLFWRHLFPLAVALAAGAFFLSRQFRTARRPVALTCAGLSVHWAYIAAYMGMWQAIDDHHMPFWTAFGEFLLRSAGYHLFTLALCFLLSVAFVRRAKREERPAAA